MRQDPSNPYVFYTTHGERISIRVKATKTFPLVEGAGPPSFVVHPPDPTTNTRLFEFTEANPPDVDAVELVFSFAGSSGKARYEVVLSSSEGGPTSTIPSIEEIPGLSIQHLGILFLANPEVA